MKRPCTLIAVMFSIILYLTLCVTNIILLTKLCLINIAETNVDYTITNNLILGVEYQCLIVIINIVNSFSYSQINGNINIYILIGVNIAFLIIFIIPLINSCRLIKYYKKSHEVWITRKRNIISISIFNIIFGIASLFSYKSILDIIFGITFLLIAIFYIIDLCREDKKKMTIKETKLNKNIEEIIPISSKDIDKNKFDK